MDLKCQSSVFAERIPGGGLGTGARGAGAGWSQEILPILHSSSFLLFSWRAAQLQCCVFLMTALLSQECSACSCSALLHPLLILPALPMPIPALQFCTKTTWAASPGCKRAACKADPNSPSSRALWGHFFINLIPLRSAVVRNSGLIPTLISTIWFT